MYRNLAAIRRPIGATVFRSGHQGKWKVVGLLGKKCPEFDCQIETVRLVGADRLTIYASAKWHELTSV